MLFFFIDSTSIYHFHSLVSKKVRMVEVLGKEGGEGNVAKLRL